MIASVNRLSLIFISAALILGAYFNPTFPVLGGLAGGWLIGFANFRILNKLVGGLLASHPKSHLGGLFFCVKMIPLIAVTAVLILQVKINPIAFVVGFGSIVFGICWQGFRGQNYAS